VMDAFRSNSGNGKEPVQFQFINRTLPKKEMDAFITELSDRHGAHTLASVLDTIKTLGFRYATQAGVTISKNDIVIPREKDEILAEYEKRVGEVEAQYERGLITEAERHESIVNIWTEATDTVADAMEKTLFELNPVYMMANSGARGSFKQIRQLAGMRGLMAKPSGEIIETPITSNFREGLSVLHYFISTHGARKGLADTALKTADSGYLTRRLVDVAQDVIIHELDCGTMDGIDARAILESGEIIEPLRERIIGRVTLEKIIDPFSGEVIVNTNEELDEEKATDIQEAGIEKVRIRSVLTCAARRGCCAKCYGRDLATGKLVELGLAVGVIAAQSIGEPGTQLTMRTFHIGGTASRVSEQNTLDARHSGTAHYEGLQVVETHREGGERIVMNRNGSIVVKDEKGRDRERYPIVYGARLKVKDGQKVEQGQTLVEWDPYTFSILTEEPGAVRFKDIIEGV